jgi:hypothetical protein
MNPISRFRFITALALLATAFSAEAQTSASYKLREQVFNNGGEPHTASGIASASFHLKLDSIGEAAVNTGLGSASYRVDSAFVSAYRPPSEVLGLRFTNRTTLVWKPEKSTGKYELYRGAINSLPGPYGSCFAADLAGETSTDTAVPTAGQGYFYLVTARNRLREEGTKGNRSNGAERSNPSPCP